MTLRDKIAAKVQHAENVLEEVKHNAKVAAVVTIVGWTTIVVELAIIILLLIF